MTDEINVSRHYFLAITRHHSTRVVVTHRPSYRVYLNHSTSQGAPGVAGPGVPDGGTTGQVLAKASNADQDTEWVDEGAGGTVTSVNAQTGVVVLDTDDIGEGATNLYHTEGRVSANTDVAANTAARHTHANSSVLASLTDAGSGQVITTTERNKLNGIEAGAEVNVVDSVAGRTGDIVLIKTDVGLSNVPNLDTTTAVANTHTHSNKAQLDLVTDGDHDVRTDNPHGVTKSQVGLGNVPNLDTTSAVADDHTHSNKAQLDLVTDGDHDVRTDNPHATTAAQVGAAATVHGHPLSDITQSGADTGQVPAWNGTAWVPVDQTGGGGGISDAPSDGVIYGRKNGAWAQPSHTELTDVGTNSHTAIDSHLAATNNPHSVTKSQVGLGNVDNTSDANKPISTAVQTALNGKQDALTFDLVPTDSSTNPVQSNGVFDALAAKAASSHTHTASNVTDFDTEVSNNTDVAANTAARHSHSNKAQLDLVTDGDHDVRTDNPHVTTYTQVGAAAASHTHLFTDLQNTVVSHDLSSVSPTFGNVTIDDDGSESGILTFASGVSLQALLLGSPTFAWAITTDSILQTNRLHILPRPPDEYPEISLYGRNTDFYMARIVFNGVGEILATSQPGDPFVFGALLINTGLGVGGNLQVEGIQYFDSDKAFWYSTLNNRFQLSEPLNVDGNLTLSGTFDQLETHKSNTSNPHSVTAAQVGLGNVTNDAQLKAASNLSDVATRQTALNNLTNVSAASNEQVMVKDTSSGNATFKTVPTIYNGTGSPPSPTGLIEGSLYARY